MYDSVEFPKVGLSLTSRSCKLEARLHPSENQLLGLGPWLKMENSKLDQGGDGRNDGVQIRAPQLRGGDQAASISGGIGWRVSSVAVVAATATWMLFEHSDLPFLTICCDVLLILIVSQFVRANIAAVQNKSQPSLPELAFSEEMVNDVAAAIRVKVNNLLLTAHDITVGRDFRLFFKVVVCLWLLSAVGNYTSFVTLVYAGTIVMVTIPGIYSKYGAHLDNCYCKIQRKVSQHFKIADQRILRRLPRSFSKDKEA